MTSSPSDTRRLCPACGYNLTGSDSPSCPECGADVQQAEAARLEGRAMWDLALSLVVPPAVVGMLSVQSLSIWGLSEVGLAALLALLVATVINDFRMAWCWLTDPDASRGRRAATAAWFTLCLGVLQVLIAVASAMVTVLFVAM